MVKMKTSGYVGIGRQVSFRNLCESVRVRVPLPVLWSVGGNGSQLDLKSSPAC